MNKNNAHTFHIPVMGLAYTIDSPIRVAHYGISSVVSITDDEVIEKAINSNFKDFEDAMQYFSALASNCDLIVTRNEKDFKNALLPVLNGESYLETLKKNH